MRKVRVDITQLARLSAAVLVLISCDRTSSVTGLGSPVSVSRALSAAAKVTRITGGGTTTFGVDLDGDGDIDGSHFGFAAVIAADGSAHGHFTCLMAGNANFLGLRLMAVQGTVTHGSADGRSFGGIATVKVLNAFGPGQSSIFSGIAYSVSVTPGGPGTGTMQLTVFGIFDGVAGDVAPGNGNYDLAVETVTHGGIAVD